MNATMTCELPPQIARLLAEFCTKQKSGTLQLDIKDGSVTGWKLTESGRIDKRL